MVMVEAPILEDVVAKVMVVTSSVGVMGNLNLLQCSMVGAMDRQVIGPIVMLSPGKSEVETYDVGITGTLMDCDCMTSVLFDPGSTFSYVSFSLATGLDLL